MQSLNDEEQEMRVALVFFSIEKRIKIQSIVRSLAKGIESQGHQVDVIDGNVDAGKKLTIYGYVGMVSECDGFFGKIPNKVSRFLKDAGNLIGKHSAAFVLKNILGSEKALVRLMKDMEKEGMYLMYSDIFKIAEEAEESGRMLHIKTDA
jgi:menaquinone-dependent protoporphyrinogen IX oxidase